MHSKNDTQHKSDLSNKRIERLNKEKYSHSNAGKLMFNDELVCRYLLQNPAFFVRNAEQIGKMRIAHSVKGAISLVEYLLEKQRKNIGHLENKITSLTELARHNQRLFESLIKLQCLLLEASDFDDFLERLTQWAKSLGLLGAYLYLFADKWQLELLPCSQNLILSPEKFEFIRLRHLQYSKQYLGQLNSTELNLLIADQQTVGSVAITLLGEKGDLGVLVFASDSPMHYQAGQGTLLLEQLSKLLPALINQWIRRR